MRGYGDAGMRMWKCGNVGCGMWDGDEEEDYARCGWDMAPMVEGKGCQLDDGALRIAFACS